MSTEANAAPIHGPPGANPAVTAEISQLVDALIDAQANHDPAHLDELADRLLGIVVDEPSNRREQANRFGVLIGVCLAKGKPKVDAPRRDTRGNVG